MFVMFQTAWQTGGHVRKRVDQTVPTGKGGLHTGSNHGGVGMGQGNESVGRHRNWHFGHEKDILHSD